MNQDTTHKEYKEEYMKTVRQTHGNEKLEETKRNYINGEISRDEAVENFKDIRRQVNQ